MKYFVWLLAMIHLREVYPSGATHRELAYYHINRAFDTLAFVSQLGPKFTFGNVRREVRRRTAETNDEQTALVSKKHKLSVCTDLSCELQGALETLERMRAAGLKVSEMGCPGKCGNGPVVSVEDETGDFVLLEEIAEGSQALEAVINGKF
mmetsp:Transcript_22315/g.50456  ORF Transcript_22315/g.50456 Transcript_22315/m.50456 type:complete len:151 (-) Transcript_22315:418-870(-)